MTGLGFKCARGTALRCCALTAGALALSCCALPGGAPAPAVALARGAAARAVRGSEITSTPATTATLSATFHPYRLGGRATLQFSFAFSAPAGQVPPPLTEVQLRYPDDLGFFLNNLGLKRCEAQRLEAKGPEGCPADSVMGYGVVRTGIVLGSTPVEESSPITVFRAPNSEGRVTLLFFAEGKEPVVTDVIFSGLLLPAREPFGGRVSIGVPLVPTLPGAPYVSVIRLHSTIGPEKVTYYEDVGGETLTFKPKGIKLPPSCPRHSFPFAAQFSFSDGSSAEAKTTIACPPPRPKRESSTSGSRRRKSPMRGTAAHRATNDRPFFALS